MTRTKKLWLIVPGVILLILMVAGPFFVRSFEPRFRKEMIHAIEKQFNGDVELGNLQLHLFPRLHANGEKLVVWFKDRRDLPPLVSIEKFSVGAGWRGLFSSPVRVNQVVLSGLVIQIPPKEDKKDNTLKNDSEKQGIPDKQNEPTRIQSEKPVESVPPFVIDSIRADGAVLKILPKQRDRDPLVFELDRISLQSVGASAAMRYDATLKNAKPPGLINATGEFGPWQREDPGNTPLSGKYTFQNADLSVFKGISGTLSSVGEFQGVLERIDAQGTTDTPDFMVRTGNQQVHLKTQFHAVIDGTSGDTMLRPVRARFGKTEIICSGGVIKEGRGKGKSVILEVTVEKGRIEDLMKFAVPSNSPLIGSIRFNAKFDLPPGDKDVVEKLNLKGTFDVSTAQFTSSTLQDKIETLSLRSRGRHDDSTDERIVSNLKGDFVMENGTISFSRLSFAVPGAEVKLEGDYGLVSEKINFYGTLQMQAKLSETQTGIKSILLKAVDPFFSKGTSGSVIPIKIAGTYKQPSFGLNLGGK